MQNNTPSRIRKVIISIPCLLHGGTEQQTLLLVRVLVEAGYYVEICCYFEYDVQMVDEFKKAGADVLLLRWPRHIGTIKFIKSLSALFRKKLPDVVHVQYMAPGLLPILAAKIARVPVIWATVHYPGTPHGFMAHSLLRFGAMLTNSFTCVSQAAEKSWFGTSFLFTPPYSDKITDRKHLTIPNAVDMEAIDKALAGDTKPVIKIENNLKGKIIIGTLARLSNEKGVDILLKAFALARKTMPNIHLLIIGDGQQKDYLHKLAADLGIVDACTWMGQLPWNEAIGCLGLMHIVVVPSRFEGFGLTAIEAMACAKPVVASCVDGLAEIIQNGKNGFLIQAENEKRFADCISDLIKDEEKRKNIGIAARKHVEANFAYPLFCERIKALYEAVGKEKGCKVDDCRWIVDS